MLDKKFFLVCSAIFLFFFSIVDMADPLAAERHTEDITTHYGNPNQPVKLKQHHWHYKAKPKSVHRVSLKHHRSHAVYHDNEGIKWLNQHTFGDVLEHGAPVYNDKDEHLDLSLLHPGKYHLDMVDLKAVEADPGYQALKKLMGDRIRLIPPQGPGYYVTVEILPSEHYVAEKLPSGKQGAGTAIEEVSQ